MARGQKTRKQKGGYKLKPEIRHSIKNPETYELLPHILKLIGGVVSFEILSVGSKFSIVFKIVVSKDASDFVDENEDPVTCFAIKFCFIIRYGIVLTIPETPKNIFVKHPISSAAFETEKKTQQYIWINSVEKGYAMVCPILTDGRVLDASTSRIFIDKLFTQDDPYKHYALSWLENGFAIGMYTMELIDSTLITFEQSGRNPNCLPSICASILVLMKCGVVHRDLHTSNVLINPVTHKSKIIDFGQVITMDALNAELSQYVHDTKFDKIKQIKDKLMKLTSLNLNTSERIMEALGEIVAMELDYNILKGNFKKNKKDGTVMVGVGRNPLKYYLDMAKTHLMGDGILSEYNQIISSGAPQTPVKVGVPRSRFFAENAPNVKAMHRTKRPSDPFGKYKFVPSFKKTNGPKGTPVDEESGTPADSGTPDDESKTLILSGTPADSATPDDESETLILSGTPADSATPDDESDAIGGTKRKRTRRKPTHTKRRRKRRVTRRRTRRHRR